jgi:TnpA family transposase
MIFALGGLMRTLQTHDRPTPLARALEKLGRIITLKMLRYIDDEAYRRRILTQFKGMSQNKCINNPSKLIHWG